jgi:hypothetical protein
VNNGDAVATRADIRELANLITGMKESLELEVAGVRAELHEFRAETVSRFDAQATRLERHAALWQTGSRWSSRMDAWAEKVDANADATRKDIQAQNAAIHDLERRLREIERRVGEQDK